jgi:hypothetical protein
MMTHSFIRAKRALLCQFRSNLGIPENIPAIYQKYTFNFCVNVNYQARRKQFKRDLSPPPKKKGGWREVSFDWLQRKLPLSNSYDPEYALLL